MAVLPLTRTEDAKARVVVSESFKSSKYDDWKLTLASHECHRKYLKNSNHTAS